MKRVFISYSHRNRDVADAICSCFESDNIRCWYAPRDIDEGRDWADHIIQAIVNDCDIMVVVLTDEANNSKQVKREISNAISSDLKIIVFKLTNNELTPGMKYYLSTVHWLDAANTDIDKSIAQLKNSCITLRNQGDNYQEEYQFEKNDYSRLSIVVLKEKSAKGDPRAMFELSERYKNGDGVIENEAEFFRLLRLSAEAGLGDALNRMGYCYEYGIAVEKDISKAIEFYKKAAKKQNNKGQCNLGRIYDEGKGIEKNLVEAIRLYKLSADQENPSAQMKLGYCYEFGYGVKQDLNMAVTMYELASAQGNAAAQCNLGYLYEVGKGVEQSYEKAKEYYEKAADKGHTRAQYNLGAMYEAGHLGKVDIEKALELYRKAADKNYTSALIQLGNLYRIGTVVTKDSELAVKYYERACKNDSCSAFFYLARMYELGNGVEQDYKRAVSLYKRAAELGSDAANNNLGTLYQEGLGVEEDIAEAVRYYSIASEAGDTYAKYNLAMLIEIGKGVELDERKAAELYEEVLTERQDSDAQLRLGKLYYHGKGVTRNWDRAFELFLQSAKAGNSKALSWVADCCQYGEGTDVDLAQAEYFYKAAIEKGDAEAELSLGRLYNEQERYSEAADMFEKASMHGVEGADYELAMCYSLGIGVARNDEKAFYLFKRAALDNDSEAWMKLGQAYQYGKGTKTDLEEAFSCYETAASLGNREAREILMYKQRFQTLILSINNLDGSELSKFKSEAERLIHEKYAVMITEKQVAEIVSALNQRIRKLSYTNVASGALRYDPYYNRAEIELLTYLADEISHKLPKQK